MRTKSLPMAQTGTQKSWKIDYFKCHSLLAVSVPAVTRKEKSIYQDKTSHVFNWHCPLRSSIQTWVEWKLYRERRYLDSWCLFFVFLYLIVCCLQVIWSGWHSADSLQPVNISSDVVGLFAHCLVLFAHLIRFPNKTIEWDETIEMRFLDKVFQWQIRSDSFLIIFGRTREVNEVTLNLEKPLAWFKPLIGHMLASI